MAPDVNPGQTGGSRALDRWRGVRKTLAPAAAAQASGVKASATGDRFFKVVVEAVHMSKSVMDYNTEAYLYDGT